MNDNPDTSCDPIRLLIRRRIDDLVHLLKEDYGAQLRDIVAEMLAFSSIAVSDEDGSLQDSTEYSFSSKEHVGGVEENSRKEYFGEHEKRWRLRVRFLNSDVHTKLQLLLREVSCLENMGRHDEAMRAREVIIKQLPEHARKWGEIFGDFHDYYPIFPRVADPLMRAYVVLGKQEAIDDLITVAAEIGQLVGRKKLDVEVFRRDAARFMMDVGLFDRVYVFIKCHPNFQQRDIFKELYLEGRNLGYLLEWADKMKRIARTRHQDTWLLKAA